MPLLPASVETAPGTQVAEDDDASDAVGVGDGVTAADADGVVTVTDTDAAQVDDGDALVVAIGAVVAVLLAGGIDCDGDGVG